LTNFEDLSYIQAGKDKLKRICPHPSSELERERELPGINLCQSKTRIFRKQLNNFRACLVTGWVGNTVLFTAPMIPAGMTGIQWNPVKSTGMRLESTRIHQNETGIRRNNCIPAGMEQESTGMGKLFILNLLHLNINLYK
jgi:hypothetical protein